MTGQIQTLGAGIAQQLDALVDLYTRLFQSIAEQGICITALTFNGRKQLSVHEWICQLVVGRQLPDNQFRWSIYGITVRVQILDHGAVFASTGHGKVEQIDTQVLLQKAIKIELFAFFIT